MECLRKNLGSCEGVHPFGKIRSNRYSEGNAGFLAMIRLRSERRRLTKPKSKLFENRQLLLSRIGKLILAYKADDKDLRSNRGVRRKRVCKSSDAICVKSERYVFKRKPSVFRYRPESKRRMWKVDNNERDILDMSIKPWDAE